MKVWINLSYRACRIASAAMLAGLLTAASTPVLAGGGSDCHFHGNKAASQETVLTCAEQNKNRLIDKGTLESSWKTVKHSTIEQIEGKKGQKEWKLTFKDPFAKDKTKEVLFMFYSFNGNHIASNFTGN